MNERAHSHRPVIVEVGSWGMEAREATWRERVLARLLAPRLDRQLAAGRSPESYPLLALRAQRLARPRMRHELAACLERMLREARRRRRPMEPLPLVDLDAVRSVEDELAALVEQLEAPVPLPARGIAIVHELVTDGSGPLYRRRSRESLARQVKSAADALDPSVDWPLSA
jgi:hypothetical protein